MTAPNDPIEFVFSKTLAAPRALVWKMWSEPEHLARWWGPAGTTPRVITFEFRKGGMFHYAMVTPMGEAYGRFIYGDIMPPDSFVFINSFADAEGNVIRAPFSPVWPLEVHNTLTLEEKDGHTIQTLRGGPLNATEAEKAAFLAMHTSMKGGFGATFQQLETYLKTL